LTQTSLIGSVKVCLSCRKLSWIRRKCTVNNIKSNCIERKKENKFQNQPTYSLGSQAVRKTLYYYTSKQFPCLSSFHSPVTWLIHVFVATVSHTPAAINAGLCNVVFISEILLNIYRNSCLRNRGASVVLSFLNTAA